MNSQLASIEQQEIDAFLSKGVNLPPQPKILMEIDAIADKPNSSLRTVADLLSKDAGMTARIFKLIHSPIFGLRQEIDSLDQALSVMGMNQALTVIKSAALRDAVGGKSAVMEAFWERADDIANFCSMIAKKQRSLLRVSAEQAHMAGLFHDCGVPILMQRFPDYGKNLDKSWPDLAEEDKKFNTSHAVAGYLVAKNWRLPETVCQAIRFHHELASIDQMDLTVAAILHMATHLRNTMYDHPDTEWEQVSQTVLPLIGLTSATQAEFEEEMIQDFQEMGR